jgi:hypothetical protein
VQDSLAFKSITTTMTMSAGPGEEGPDKAPPPPDEKQNNNNSLSPSLSSTGGSSKDDSSSLQEEPSRNDDLKNTTTKKTARKTNHDTQEVVVVTAASSTSFRTMRMTASGRTDVEDEDHAADAALVKDDDLRLLHKDEEMSSNSSNKLLQKKSSILSNTSSRNSRRDRGPAAVSSDGDPCTISLVLTLWSNIMFAIASCFYVTLAVVGLQFETQVQDYPDEVYNSQDDEPWVEMGFQDDYILKFGDSETGIWVTRYTTFYFLAALCFLLTGFLDYCQEPGVVAAIFIMAGAFGVASATVSEKDERLSTILNSVSVHLFCLEAISHYLYRHWLADASVWLKYFVHFGDGCWIVGSLMDVVLSYIDLMRDRYSVRLSTADVVAASLWLTCSLVYIVATIIQVSRLFREYRQLLQQRAQKGASQYNAHQQPQQHDTTLQRQHIPNRGSRYEQQQRRQQQQLQQQQQQRSDGDSIDVDDYANTAPPRDAIGESGHSTDTVFA